MLHNCQYVNTETSRNDKINFSDKQIKNCTVVFINRYSYLSLIERFFIWLTIFCRTDKHFEVDRSYILFAENTVIDETIHLGRLLLTNGNVVGRVIEGEAMKLFSARCKLRSTGEGARS